MAFGPGSIAFTGYSADSADAVSFVTLTDIPAGTVIYFHQGKWDGDSFKNGTGAHWSWTATSDVPAGSIVSIAMSTSAPPTSNIGSLAIQSAGSTISLYLADALYAYVGEPKAPEAFLAAIAPKDFLGPSYDPMTLAGTGLVEGETAVALGTTLASGFAEIGAYDGPRLGSGSFEDYLSQINDPANWISQSAPGAEASDGVGPDVPFSLAGFSDDPNAQSVSFAADSLQITQAEGDSGDTIFTFTVSRTGGTTGTIHFTGSIGLAGLTGADDFGGTVPLNFSGTIAEGQSSGTFTVRVSGDMQFEREEIFKLALQTVTNVGGPDAVLGEDTLAGGTIVNDDPAQTSIAFVGLNTDGGDNLAFVAVTGIAAGTVIYFTDNAWTGSGFTTGESVWSWTAGSDIPAGTVITMDKLNVAGAASSNHGTISFITGSSANLDENNLVEQVYAYLGAPGQPSAFLTAISNGALTLTGTGLTVGVDAIALTPAGADIAYYNGPRTGLTTMEAYLAAINNPANWSTQDTSADNTNDGILPELPFPAHSFSTDPAVQIVQFAAGSLNLTKSEGQNGTETAFTFTIERTGGTNGEVTFSVRVPAGTYATAANGADFVGGALPMITGTIPAGSNSTTVTILVKGDGLFEVAERFLLVLESASNPNASSIVVGNDSIAVGTINNDDNAPTKILAGDTHSAIINVASQLVIDQGGSLVVPTGNAINWQSANANVVIENSGLIGGGITSANNNGGSFTLNNQATGVIRGVIDLGSVKAGTAVTLNNAGRIELTTDRMDLRDAKAGTITVNNLAGGLILQTTVTPDILRPGAGSVVNNYGTIKHADGLVGGGDGVDLAADAGNVNNYVGGVIEASRHAVTGDGKMRVYNEGTMIGRNGSAVNMDNDGTEAERAIIINRGNMEGRSANLADSDGDAVDIDGLLTLDNYGRIAGLGHNGYHDGEPNVSEGLAVGGGIIRNYEGGEIYGYGRAIQIDNSSNNNALGASTITNEGLIRGDGNGPTGVTPAEAALFAERIRGGEAINIVGSFGDTLTNSGEIIGGVKMGGGNDTLVNSGLMVATGGSAVDMGDGNDTVTLQGASEVIGAILLGAGNDTLNAAADLESDIEVDGGDGDDIIKAGAGDDTLSGGLGNDTIDGGIGDDAIGGGEGDDTILGGAGDDDIQGAAGTDTIEGGIGDDTIDGGEGNDHLDGGEDTDTLLGGAGDDTLVAGSGDLVYGGAGNDTIELAAGATPQVIDGGEGDDTVKLVGAGAGALAATTGVENLVVQAGNWSVAGQALAFSDITIKGGAAVTSGINLGDGDHLVIEAGGKVSQSGNTHTVLWLGGTTTVDNYGTIELANSSASAFRGQSVAGSLTFNNYEGAEIKGPFVVSGRDFAAGSSLQLTNAGKMMQVDVRSDTAAVTVENTATGVITADHAGRDLVQIGGNVVFTNAGRIVSAADGAKSGGDAVVYDGVRGTSVSITNRNGGLIEGSRHAVTGESKATIVNEAGGVMIGRNGSAVNIDNDPGAENTVSVTNRGVMEGRSANVSDSDGDAVDVDGLLNLENWGSIKGLGHNGRHDGEPNVSEGIAAGAAIITNHAGGEIYGYGRAIQIDNSGNSDAFAATTIVNEGLIKGDGNLPTAVTPEEVTEFEARIRGGEAINIVGSFADSLTNSGEIVGGVKMGGGNDTLVNSGSMTATGGSAIDMGDGDDTVTLQGASQVLGAILLGAGNDVMSADGGGSLVVDGGAGEDIIRLGGMGAGILGGIADIETVSILSGAWTLTDEDAATTFAFSEGAQTLTLGGDLLADGGFAGTIAGFGQEDRIHLSGLAGTLATLGEDNLLSISGGAHGSVTIQLDPAVDYGNAAFKLVSDGADGAYLSYEIVTNNGDDVMTGGNGNDVLDGGAGNDTLKGGAGNDTLLGGTGVDDIDGGSGLDSIEGGAGTDTIKGGSGNDVIDGGDGDDVIDAGSDADTILGGAGNDTIKGGSGDDVIGGGAGNDTLNGGSGKDVFVFAAGFGHDAVTDFTLSGVNADAISFSTDLFADYAAVRAHAAQDGHDVVITFDADNVLALHNQQLTALSADDFRFV